MPPSEIAALTSPCSVSTKSRMPAMPNSAVSSSACTRVFLSPEIIIADCGAAAPSRKLGGVQIIELINPHLFFEGCLRGKTVQEHCQPPGHARSAPDATQRHVRIAIEVMRSACAVSLGQRSGQIKHV